jgi:hypothetical protein
MLVIANTCAWALWKSGWTGRPTGKAGPAAKSSGRQLRPLVTIPEFTGSVSGVLPCLMRHAW